MMESIIDGDDGVYEVWSIVDFVFVGTKYMFRYSPY